MTQHLEVLREVWEVTEYKDGAVFRTRNTGRVEWRDAGLSDRDGDVQYVEMSNTYQGRTLRMVSDA